MPPCEEYETLISALLDHENTEEDLAVLIEHLAQCEDCKTYLSDQIRIHQAMQDLSCMVPVGFTDGIMARIHETKQEPPLPTPTPAPSAKKKRPFFPRGARWAGLAACCAVILAGVWFTEFGAMHMDATADSAAPQMGWIEIPATAAGTAERGAEYRSEDSETETPDAMVCSEDTVEESTGHAESANSDCAEISSEPPAYAAQLTTGSADIAAWVERTLREAWVSGTVYEITRAQYEELTALLEAQNAPFTVTVGSEDSTQYFLCAK